MLFATTDTTANPLPASPALAASIDAFRTNKLVCNAIRKIDSVNSEIFFTSLDLFIADNLFSISSFFSPPI